MFLVILICLNIFLLMRIFGEGSIYTSTQGRTFFVVVLIAFDILVPLCIYAWLLPYGWFWRQYW